MHCKNCATSLPHTTNYCFECGAKVIRNRLTFKSLWIDVSERFLNIENTLFKTFFHFFTKPEAIIEGYIRGTRKKYVNPFTYFTIAITIGGLFIFIAKKFSPDLFKTLNMTNDNDQLTAGMSENMFNSILEYQSLFYFCSIPLLAGISRLIFLRNKKFNFTEHLVINTYTYSHVSIITNLVYFFTFWNSELYASISLIALLLQMVYYAYVLKRLYNLNLKQTILKTLLFFCIITVIMGVFIAIATIFMFVFTDMGEELIRNTKDKNAVGFLFQAAETWLHRPS